MESQDASSSPSQSQSSKPFPVRAAMRSPSPSPLAGTPTPRSLAGSPAVATEHRTPSAEEDELDRYENKRRSKIRREVIKKILSPLLPKEVLDEKTLIILSGTAKLIVGELVTRARALMTKRGHGPTAPIPYQVYLEVYADLSAEGGLPFCPTAKSVFH